MNSRNGVCFCYVKIKFKKEIKNKEEKYRIVSFIRHSLLIARHISNKNILQKVNKKKKKKEAKCRNIFSEKR